jgi:hypothetical protein
MSVGMACPDPSALAALLEDLFSLRTTLSVNRSHKPSTVQANTAAHIERLDTHATGVSANPITVKTKPTISRKTMSIPPTN